MEPHGGLDYLYLFWYNSSKNLKQKDLKPVEWVGSSRKDLRKFPKAARRMVGYAILYAQAGLKHDSTTPMKGNLREVMEIRADIAREAFRAMYLTKLAGVVYVLHAFDKKATKSRKTPQRDLDVIELRLKVAKNHYAENYKNQKDNRNPR